MFSPILAISSSRRSSRFPSASGPSASTASSAASAKARNSSFLETGSVSQPTATIAPVFPETVASTSPSVVARPARLPAAAMPCSRRSRWAASTSPPVSSSARLAAIIPAPVRSRSSLTRLAEIWTWLMKPPRGRRARERAPARPQLPVRARLRPRLPARPPRSASASGSGSGSGWVSSAGAGAKSAGLARCLPSEIASPSACTTRLHERIASSLPGITKSASSGSQFVSTSAITGIPSRRASFTASCSLRRSTMKIASGCLRMSATPPRFASSFSSSACIEIRSLGGQQVELALVAQPSQLVQMLDPLRDRAPVGEQAAEPAVVHVRHARALGLLLDRVLGLLLGADEEDGAAALGEVADEALRLLEALERLLQVDDVDAAALAEDETPHLRVPAARLVAEMDAGLQELSHADCHGSSFLVVVESVRRRGSGGTGAQTPAPPPARIAGLGTKKFGKCSGRSGLVARGPIHH